MEVTLEPKTRNGKNRLARVVIALPAWDGTWRVVRSCDRVTFALHRDGPWHLLEPVADAPFLERFWRWVSATDDADFILRSNAELRGASRLHGEASLSNDVLGV